MKFELIQKFNGIHQSSSPNARLNLIMKLSTSSQITVTLLNPDNWFRLKNIRLRALVENPEAFGPTFDEENKLNEQGWRNRFKKEDYLIGSIENEDVGTMYIEVLKGDHGATCWIGGCWTDPKYRGFGVMKSMFEFIDLHSKEKGWQRQGLGVWVHNQGAIKAYESIGFSVAGEKMASTSRPGSYFQHMVRDSKLI